MIRQGGQVLYHPLRHKILEQKGNENEKQKVVRGWTVATPIGTNRRGRGGMMGGNILKN